MNNNLHPTADRRVNRRRRRLTSVVVAAGLTASLGFVALGPTGTAHAAVSCTARLVDATPTPGTPPVLKVTTASGAKVSARVHFSTGTVIRTDTVSRSGIGRLTLPAKGLPGVLVRVRIRASKGSASAVCSTAFRPGGAPGESPVPPAARRGTAPDAISGMTARTLSGLVDDYGHEYGVTLNCFYTDHAVTFWHHATHAPYYRSVRVSVFNHQNQQWSYGNWSPAFVGGTYHTKGPWDLHPGWYTAYLQVAVWTTNGWEYYGQWADHAQGIGYAAGGVEPSRYNACYV